MEAGENPSRLAALNIEPHEEAGYTSAVVTINRIQPTCCNRAGSIYGARAALGRAGGKQDPRSLWLGKLRQRRHPNVAAVALANKNARIVWSMLSGNAAYQPDLSVKAA
ncbi:Mobile element protein (plasmid) [Sinorhizobium fredii CCBAU 83666]|uniref:hypothetical protein n=1 Tax=Rhizobium fredii TaxID=380 RepID=UPI000BC00D5D|nr:Mobile element protein [Sinorhizobium fredii CCBAU 83666]